MIEILGFDMSRESKSVERTKCFLEVFRQSKGQKMEAKKEFLSDVSTIGEIFGEIFFILFTRSWCL
jgi:hypothetical protein